MPRSRDEFNRQFPDLADIDLTRGLTVDTDEALLYLRDRQTWYEWRLLAFLVTPTLQIIQNAFQAMKDQIPEGRERDPLIGIMREKCPMVRSYSGRVGIVANAYQNVFAESLVAGSGDNQVQIDGRTVTLGSFIYRTQTLYLNGNFIQI